MSEVHLCSEADPAMPQGAGWCWVRDAPPSTNMDFQLGREKQHLVDRGMPVEVPRWVYRGCQCQASILSRWALDFMDRIEKQKNKRHHFPLSVCVYILTIVSTGLHFMIWKPICCWCFWSQRQWIGAMDFYKVEMWLDIRQDRLLNQWLLVKLDKKRFIARIIEGGIHSANTEAIGEVWVYGLTNR